MLVDLNSHEYAYDLSSDCKNNTGRHWSKEKMGEGGGGTQINLND